MTTTAILGGAIGPILLAATLVGCDAREPAPDGVMVFAAASLTDAVGEIARLADRVVVLQGGRVAPSGTVFDVTARVDLQGPDPDFEVGAVLDATVAAHDPADALSELEIPDGRLVVPAIARPVGTRVRVRIAARDVMLAFAAPADVSANNVLAGVVDEIRPGTGAHADVLVRIGTWRLPARITRRSVRRLALAPGRRVHALVKAVTIDRGGALP